LGFHLVECKRAIRWHGMVARSKRTIDKFIEGNLVQGASPLHP